MNEILFFAHIFLIFGFLVAALRIGASGLIAFVSLQTIFANLFVIKQITLFGMNVTCSDAYAVGALLTLNLTQEFFGKEVARKAIEISLLASIFFAAMSAMHLWYNENGVDTSQSAFATIFSSTPRIIFSSIFVFFLVQQIDMHLFGWLRKKWALPIRVGVSLLISQAIDTILFTFLALSGIVSSLFDIILVSIAIKGITILSIAPFTTFVRRFLRQKEVA